MKIFAISDLHLSLCGAKPMEVFGGNWEGHFEKIKADWVSKVTKDDVVLLSGDTSWAMYLNDAVAELAEIGRLPGVKILIRGNHDYWWASIKKIREVLPEGMFAIQNDAVRVGGVVFCGTRGWTVPEAGERADEETKKLYARETLRLELALAAAKRLRQEGDKLVGMMHFPPFNARYEVSDFANLFHQYDTDFVVYGHLHGAKSRAKTEVELLGVPYHLTSCDLLDFQLKEILEI